MNKEKTTWRLFVMKPDRESIKAALEARFSRVNERYVLIYSEKPMNAVEIGEDEVWRLNAAETEWLAGCNVQLLLEDAQKRQDEIRKNLAEKIAALEKALENQQKVQEKK